LALLGSLAPATPSTWAAGTCAVALGLLIYSFAADVVIQLSSRPRRGAPNKSLVE
jgi:hypothetical protein